MSFAILRDLADLQEASIQSYQDDDGYHNTIFETIEQAVSWAKTFIPENQDYRIIDLKADARDQQRLFDPYQRYDEAVQIVKETGNAGTSHLQRQLRIGFNHASLLLERMEHEKIVSVFDKRTGKRTVLI